MRAAARSQAARPRGGARAGFRHLSSRRSAAASRTRRGLKGASHGTTKSRSSALHEGVGGDSRLRPATFVTNQSCPSPSKPRPRGSLDEASLYLDGRDQGSLIYCNEGVTDFFLEAVTDAKYETRPRPAWPRTAREAAHLLRLSKAEHWKRPALKDERSHRAPSAMAGVA